MFRLSAKARLPVIDAGSLFDAGPVPGLTYQPNYISETEEAALIAAIDSQPWSMELLRRRQWYGWAYDDSPLGVDGDYRSSPMPEWLIPFARRLAAERYLDGVADRALINEYFPGQGIGAHKDRDIERIKAVAIISLGSGLTMDFARLGHATRCQYLQPRSLVVMRGEVREQWTHGIVGRKNDKVGGLVIPRERRMSLTFRYVAPSLISMSGDFQQSLRSCSCRSCGPGPDDQPSSPQTEGLQDAIHRMAHLFRTQCRAGITADAS